MKIMSYAGLTNSVFMKSGGVLLQILPYGFTYNQTSGLRVRGNIFVDVALCLNGTYLQVNYACFCLVDIPTCNESIF